MSEMKPVSAMTIAGSDSGGGAGIQADLKTFAAFEVHGISVVTSATAQNTRGVEGVSDLPGEFVGTQIDAVMDDFDVEWSKTGMVSRTEIIETIEDKAKEHDLNLVADPVMKSASGSLLLKRSAREALEDFLGVAKLVTPNIDEAIELSGIGIDSVGDMKDAAREIARIGPENVLITGGHLEGEKICNVLFDGDDFLEYEARRVSVPDVHGSGCTFSAAITAELAKGKDIKRAIKNAGNFMVDVVEKRLRVGSGLDVANPMSRIWKLASDGEEVEEVLKAAKTLVDVPEFTRLIPEVGTNIVMGPRNAQGICDVVGLNGRIVEVENRPFLSGVPTRGGSEHMAKLVMTVMKHDPYLRAAMNIRYSEKILSKCRDLGFDMASFDRGNEPDGVETMEWGPDKAIENFGGVPDVIYDKGAFGKEPMIRLIGERSTEIAEHVIDILRELEK